MTVHLSEMGLMNAPAANEQCRRHLQLALEANPNLAGAQRMLAELEAGSQPRATLQFDVGR